MRRRFHPYISTLSIVFMLALSVIYIPFAMSQDKSKIINALDELHDYVSDNSTLPNGAFEHQNNGSIAGKRGALGNKVKAVIHKIRSGAYHGAIKKLTNDIGKKAEQWLVQPWEDELKEKIQDIIDLIKRCVRPDFSITASPDTLTIEQNSSDTSIINITSWNNFNDPVDLIATLSPAIAEISATLDPTQVTPPPNGSITSTLTVEVAADAEPDDYEITVTGTSDALEHSVEISLEVTAVPPVPPVQDFSIFVFPTSLTIQQGSSDASIIIITSLEGFDQSVDLAVTSESIAGVTPVLDLPQVTPLPSEPATSTLTVEVAENAVPDTYTITVTGMSDTLQHSAHLTLTVTTPPSPPDLEPPMVRIVEPTNQSYLAGQVNIVVVMYDKNFKTANLTIDHTLLASWTPENVSTGVHSVLWDTTTPEFPDALYDITLKAEDEAGHIGEATVTVTVDNTSPIIEAPTWKPEEPSTNEQVNVTVKVSDPQPGSGLQNVTLWYKNTTMEDWQPIPMSLNATSGNWTATIPEQSRETTIEFYIEAFDIAGNKARKPVGDETYEYKVIAPAGIPLAWIVAIILLILAATIAAIYLWRKRRREKQGTSSSRVENYKLTIQLCF